MSTTEHRLAANRANALHSTGPVTAGGKATASRNATRHGLLSGKLFLEDEDPSEFQIMFGDLEKEQEKLNHEVENLRQFEREYRSRLRSYFTQQLELLTSGETTSPAGEEQPQPKRLRSILGEDDG